MKHWLFSVILLLAAHAGVSPAQDGRAAGRYPTKPIRLIVPFAPGGGNDTMARILGVHLTESWGQQIVIDNRPGASGVLASEIVAKGAPDGYTILMGNVGSHGIFPALYARLPYDAVKDFTAITLVGSAPNIIVAHPGVPANNLKELIALAKARPGQLNFGSSGPGSSGHLAGEILKTAAGIDMVHIPYRGIAPATTDLLGGQIPLTFSNMLSVTPHVKAGRLKAIAVTSLKRSPAAPDVPAVSETIPGFDVISWWGVVGPPGIPREVVTRLNREIARILRLPDVKERLARQGVDPAGNTPEEFAAYIKTEIAKYRKAVKDAGVAMDLNR